MRESWGILVFCIISAFVYLGNAQISASLQDQTVPYVGIGQLVNNGGYQTKVEVTRILNDNTGSTPTMTYYADEFHDWRRKRGRIDQFFAGTRNSQYYFSDSQQTVSIGETSCQVDSFESISFINQTVYWEYLEPKNLIAGPSSVLWRETVNTPTQVTGTVEIRGIPCIKYTAVDKKDTGVVLNYYLSSPEWKGTGASKKSIPIRVEANGEYVTPGMRTPTKLNLVIDFISFIPDIPRFSTFQVPAGVGCEGLKSNGVMTLPLVEDQFSYTSEVYNIFKSEEQLINHVLIYKFWFDALNQLMSVRGVDNKFEPFTVVADFSTGVQYKTHANGTCTLGGIKDPMVRSDPSGVVRMMQDGNKFLGLDGTYYYLGRGLVRNVNCDIWESVKNDKYFVGRFYKRIVQTVYFVSPEIMSVTSSDDNFQVPVKVERRLQVNATSPVQLIEWNMFGFDDHEGGFFDIYNNINVEPCFNSETQKDYFMVHFPVPNKILKENILNRARLTQDARVVIAQAAKVSLLRISSVRLYTETVSDESDIYALGVMLDKPLTIAGFYKYADLEAPLTSEPEIKSGVETPNDCATACVSKDNCKGFSYCDADPSNSVPVKCYLTNKDVGEIDDRTGSGNCQLYFRSDLNSKANEPNITQALQNIQYSITVGKLILNIKPDAPLIASRLEKGLKPFNDFNRENLYETVYSDFQIRDSGETFLSFDSSSSSAEMCYQSCVSDVRLSCASFSYCPTSGRCRLSPLYLSVDVPGSTDNIERATRCTVYRKRDSDFFEETPGKVPKVPGTKDLENVPNQDACAVWCKSEKTINCKGYEYCSETKSCVLHETHNVEESNLQPNENTFCTHYSLKYSSEFIRSPGIVVVSDDKAETIMGVSFEECAKACRVRAILCRSINFCVGSTELGSICSINTVALTDPGVKTIPSGICQHYSLSTPLQDQTVPYVGIGQLVNNGGYQTKVEVTRILNDNTGSPPTMTYYADEFHDWRRKRGRIDQFSAGTRNSQYYFSDTQQTISIGETSCQVDSFETISFINQTVYWEYLEPKNLIAGPSSVLWRETVNTPTQVTDIVDIRDIPCIKYTAVDKKDTGVILNYYLSSPQWKGTGASKKSIPIRVEANGEYVTPGMRTPTKLNLVIDFISFIPDIPRFSTFQVPAGVGCEGLKSNGVMTLPLVEDQFSYTSEAYNIFQSKGQLINHVLIYKFWFDALNQLMSVRGVDSKFEPFTVVADFSTGVQYKTHANGTCTLGGIKDPMVRSDPSGVVRMMQDGNKFLGLDGTYYYLGRGLVRNVNCDIWETVKNDKYFIGRFYKRIVQTVYFVSPEIMSVASSDGNMQVPAKIELRLQVNATSPVELIESNIFDFDDTKQGLFDIYNNINVETCFTFETQKDYFMVHFPIPNKILKENNFNRARLTQDARVVIAQAAKVSLLRISSVTLFTDTVIGESDISILGVMLDKAPPLAGFYIYADLEAPLTSETEIKSGVETSDDCATACVSKDDCKGFSFCDADPSKNVPVKCFVTNKDVGEINDRTGSGNCQLYFRSDLNSKANEPNITQALQNIQDSITVGKLILNLKPDAPLIASRIDKKLTPFNWQDKDLFETAFTQRKLDKAVETVKEVLSTTSASECYQMCLDEKSIFCSSFSYCGTGGNCRLSSVFVDANRSSSLEEMEKESATNCNVYRRAALNFFEMFPGMSTKREGQKYHSALASANECALACREEKSFSCKGFEFCESTRLCVMHDTHTLDLDEENGLKTGTPMCNHYSLKYSAEFADMGHFELTGPDSTTLNTLTFEECAKMCSETTNFKCLSINYCPGESVLASRCQLFPVTSDAPGYDLQLSSKGCSNYIRRSEASLPPSTDTKNRVSGGRFAATIIGVIIFGIVLGAGAFLLYSMYRSRHQNADGMTLTFIKTN